MQAVTHSVLQSPFGRFRPRFVLSNRLLAAALGTTVSSQLRRARLLPDTRYAESGGVNIAYQVVVGSGITFSDRGDRELKGIQDRWRLFAVDSE